MERRREGREKPNRTTRETESASSRLGGAASGGPNEAAWALKTCVYVSCRAAWRACSLRRIEELL